MPDDLWYTIGLMCQRITTVARRLFVQCYPEAMPPPLAWASPLERDIFFHLAKQYMAPIITPFYCCDGELYMIGPFDDGDEVPVYRYKETLEGLAGKGYLELDQASYYLADKGRRVVESLLKPGLKLWPRMMRDYGV